MSSSPRRRALGIHRDADWSVVSETTDDHGVNFRVLWSADSWLYLGVCDSYPNLSWQAATAEEALAGIPRQARHYVGLSPTPARESRRDSQEGSDV